MCSAISRPSPHSQLGVRTSGTFRLNRKSRRPISPVLIWISSELSALVSPSCLFRVLSWNKACCWCSKSSAGPTAALPSLSFSYLSRQASSTTFSVTTAPPARLAIAIAASSTAVGFCGPRGCGQPLLFLPRLNLWYILVHAVLMMLPGVFSPPWPSSRAGCCMFLYPFPPFPLILAFSSLMPRSFFFCLFLDAVLHPSYCWPYLTDLIAIAKM